jgi:hypothetical protein
MRETHAKLLQMIAERRRLENEVRHQRVRRLIADARRLTTAEERREA